MSSFEVYPTNETKLTVSNCDFVNLMDFQTDLYSVRALNASAELDSSPPTWGVFVAISTILAVFIITGNALVIAAYARNPRLRRTGMYKFLVSLAISDFLVGSVAIPMWIYSSAVKNSTEERKGLLLSVFKYVDIFSAMASIFHLVAISVERHIAIVVQPFKPISTSFYRVMITAAWVLAISFSIVWKIEFVRKFYALVVFVFGFLLPIIVIAFVYGNIFRTARALIRRTPEFRAVSIASRRSNRIRDERRVAITVFLVSILFVLCWLPFFLASIIAKFGVLPSEKLHLEMLIRLVKWLHYSNSAVNPMLYAFRDREMRAAFRKLSPQACTKHSASQDRNDRLELQRPNPLLVSPEAGEQRPSAQSLQTLV